MIRVVTEEDLNNVIKESNSEAVIREFWKEKEIYERYNEFVNGSVEHDENGNKLKPSLKDKYEELYPSFKIVPSDFGFDQEVIKYITYDKVDEIPVLDENEMPVLDEETGLPKIKEEPVISDEYYQLDDDGKILLNIDGNKVLKEDYTKAMVIPSFEYFKNQQLEKWFKDPANQEVDMSKYVTFINPILIKMVNAEFEKASKTITSAYPETEQQTWPVQRAEALAFKADAKAPTPMLDGIATNRKIDKSIIVDKVIAKSTFLDSVMGKAIGYRQYAEDSISKIKTIEQLDALVNELTASRDLFYKILSNKG